MKRALRQNLFHYGPVHIRQPEMASLEFEGQLGMVDAETVKNRRVQVVHVYRILHDVVAKVVGLAVRNSGLDAASGHPDSETAWMMIAAVVVGRQLSLAI